MGKTLSQIEVMADTSLGTGGPPIGKAGVAGATRLKPSIPTPKPPTSIPQPASSFKLGGVAPGSILVWLLILMIVGMLVATITVVAIYGNTSNTELNTASSQIVMDVLSVVFVLTAIGALMFGRRNLRGGWGIFGFGCLTITLITLSITLSAITMNTLNSAWASFGAIAGSFVLAITYGMLYYGSTGNDSFRTLLFYGSIILLIVYALFFVIVFGNPVGIPTTIADGQYTPVSDKYKIIYNSDNSLQGISKRRLFDQVYLSIAYPTLGSFELPPLHNSNEVRGSHYLSQYGKHLSNGSSAFLFDIYYESNASSPNVNTWRVGTLNTDTGAIQNRRTISLESVLSSTNRAIEASSGNPRLIYLFLNPRYTTSQRDSNIIPRLEDSLAKLIQTNITYLTIPSLSVSLSENSRIEDQYLSNASKQVIVFLGGTRNASSLSTKLKNTVHGVVNLTDCYVRTEGAQAYNAIAYDSKANQNQRRLNLGTGSFAGTNESKIDEFIRNDSRQSVQSDFVATLPDTTNMNSQGKYIAYKNEIPPYISHSVSFPFVYPHMLGSFTDNETFFAGYSPILAPKSIISLIFSNEDGDDKPARQRMNNSMRCSEEYNNAKVLNPAQDSEWSALLGNPKIGTELSKAQWCNNFKGNQDNRKDIIITNPNVSSLVLYYPGNTYSGGMIPKPTLVQTTNGDVYQLRRVIQSQTVIPESIES